MVIHIRYIIMYYMYILSLQHLRLKYQSYSYLPWSNNPYIEMVILCRVSVDNNWSTFVYFEVIGWNTWSRFNCVSLLEVLALVRNVTNLWGLNPLLQISHRLLKYMKWESITKSFFLTQNRPTHLNLFGKKWLRKKTK